jgi:hypothetical protein
MWWLQAVVQAATQWVVVEVVVDYELTQDLPLR